MTQPAFLDAILVDEVGIESGSLDGILLKSAYQPVFSPRGENLQITGFDASTVVWREDTEFDLSQLSGGAFPDPDFVAGLCQRLSVDNHRNLDIAGRDLFLDHALAGNRRLQDSLLDAARLARSVGEETLVPGQVVCRISQAVFLADADDLARLEALREAGMRIMLDAFDHDLDTAHSQRRFMPDIAEIGAAWFGKIAERGAAARLLRPLVETHRANGTRVHIRGVSTGEHLELAIASGAEYLSGDYLAEPALAGCPIEDQPRPVAELLSAHSGAQRRPA